MRREGGERREYRSAGQDRTGEKGGEKRRVGKERIESKLK